MEVAHRATPTHRIKEMTRMTNDNAERRNQLLAQERRLNIRQMTAVTCDRCENDSCYSGEAEFPDLAPDWWKNYALAWAAELTPYQGGCGSKACDGTDRADLLELLDG